MSVEHPSPHLLIIHIHRTSCFYHQWAILCSDSLVAAEGVVVVNGKRLEQGDGIAASGEQELTITAETEAEFILVEAA